MAIVLGNRAKMSTSTTGTGTITLGSAATGYQTFANAGITNGQTIRYAIEDGTNFEIGSGTYTSSGTTLTRSVTESSNSDSAISLSGTAVVFVTATVADLFINDGASSLTTTGVGTFASLDISGNIDVDGTTNLDAVDIDGAVQLDSTLTVGVNDQGYDVKLFGDTASAFMLWDTSADDLILSGAAGLIVPDGQLTLGSTALTSTAAELNYNDTGAAVGTVVASKTVTVDANKDVASFRNITLTGELDAGSLDISGDADIDGTLETDALSLNGTAVTTTGAEINLIDGGTSRGTTAVASGDGLLVNDAGTMRMTNVDTVSTYFSSHSVGGGNIVTVGALNSGSITSGFGAIDNGSSAITTTGVGSFGSLDISGAIDVDGTTNLDVVDIDGAVDMASTLLVTGVATLTAKPIANAGISVKNGATGAGFVEFFEDTDNGTNKVTLIGPASTADVTLTLPSATGIVATTDDATALAIALG